MNLIQKLKEKKLITPPSYLPDNVQYLTLMGSIAYGTENASSDWDVYGWCFEPKTLIFPHLAGHIIGFGKQIKRFEQYQQHHIIDKSAKSGKGIEYDITVYGVVKYFQLVMQNNPNMLDSLFTPRRVVLTSTKISELVRDNKKLFLSLKVKHTFSGYAYAQLNKMQNKKKEGKRSISISKYGYDVKFAYHLVRLLLEVEEILSTGDLTLDANAALLRNIREGGWSENKVIEFFNQHEKIIDDLYNKNPANLPHSKEPEFEERIKNLLLDVLEEHYGNLSNIVYRKRKSDKAIQQIIEVLQRGGYL